MLKEKHHEKLKEEYLQNLYRLGKINRFRNQDMEFDGIISGIDEAGRLRIEVEGSERIFGVKQLTFL